MHLDDYGYEGPNEHNMLKIVVAILGIILMIILIVLIVNKDEIVQRKRVQEKVTLSTEEKERKQEKEYVNSLVSGETVTSQDMAFWDLYELGETTETATVETETVETLDTTQEQDPSTDGKHTLVKTSTGEEVWVEINQYIEKNTYDFSGLSMRGDIMKYYVDSELSSFVCANISKTDGDVNFYQLKRSGVDFVILKIGQRGYQTGEISLDENFETNLEKCIEAGMDFGISFTTQAISKEEAVEEAQFVLDQIQSFQETYQFSIKYPVVLSMEQVQNDAARTSRLDRNQRTIIADNFLKTIKEGGYTPMLYANKEWLLQKLYLSHLKSYDIWLDQVGDIPDYPYQFVLWHYTSQASVSGADQPVSLSISFIDYSLR